MACLQAVYRRNLHTYCRRRLLHILSRHESSAVSADLSLEHEVDPEATVPLVPKHRDPHPVLKALSSTLTPLPNPLLMGGLSLADPMAPRTRAAQLMYQRAREAGRMSAQYVITRWPNMFPDVRYEPDVNHSQTLSQGINEETLKSLIARKRTGPALKLFKKLQKKLQKKGDAVSLEIQNSLLELLAYHGAGNPREAMREKSGVSVSKVVEMVEEVIGRGEGEGEVEVEQTEEQMSSEETAGHSSGEDVVKVIEVEETTNEVEEKRSSKDRAHLMQLQHQTTSGQIWSLINHAEQFFAKMPEKNGATYDALILGLVKFMNFDRAWEMFGQMSKEGHQASVATYNSLLYVIGNTTIPDPWSKAMSLVQQMSHEPVVKPNISTMNLLLEISSQTGKTSAMQLSLKTFREALHLGLEPTLTTFLALLRAHIKSSDGSVLYDITDYLEKNQHVLQITDNQDIYFFLVAMTTARSMLDHELATRLVRLCDRDNWMLCQNITLFISYFLITISGRVPIETLRKEYYQYVPKIILPMEWTYGVMFAACEHQDSPTFALELWNHVMKYRVGVSSLETLVRFCGAMSKRLFPSEVDAVLVALNQAWDKCQQMNASPPPLMISQIIRLHCMKKDLDQAWEYFSKFEEKPTFLALVELLKASSSVQDAERTAEVLNMMLQYGMVLSTTFVRDICRTAGVSDDTREELVGQFRSTSAAKDDQESVDIKDDHKSDIELL